MRRGYGRKRGLEGTYFTELNEKSQDLISQGQQLQETGEKFNSDKDQLEAQLEKITESKTADDQVKAYLEEAITSVQEQYQKEVVDEQTRVQEALQETTKEMNEASDELEEQSKNLQDLKMDAASTDASKAAAEADAKKQSFERTRTEFLEKLNTQIDQANMIQREMRTRRLSGRR